MLTIVSPDAGRVRVADQWSDRLGAPLAIIHKRRDPNIANEVKVHEVVGEVKGRTCVLVDDMIDTAGTITAAAEALFENGAAEVIVRGHARGAVRPGVDRLKNSRISEVVVTNTLPDPGGAAGSTSSQCSPSPRCWRARSARSSTTAR